MLWLVRWTRHAVAWKFRRRGLQLGVIWRSQIWRANGRRILDRFVMRGNTSDVRRVGQLGCTGSWDL